RMSFGDHLEDLRRHLIRALAGFFVCMLLSFAFSRWVVDFIKAPIENQLMEFYQRRVERVAQNLEQGDSTLASLNEPTEMRMRMKRKDVRALLRKVGVSVSPENPGGAVDEWVDFPLWVQPLAWEIRMHDAQRQVGKPPLLSTMNVMEGFMVYVKVSAL